jgi:hypothetical protein
MRNAIFWMLRCAALVRTDVSEERVASIIRVKRLRELVNCASIENGVFWDVTPCGSCKNRRFGGTYFFSAYVGC